MFENCKTLEELNSAFEEECNVVVSKNECMDIYCDECPLEREYLRRKRELSAKEQGSI